MKNASKNIFDKIRKPVAPPKKVILSKKDKERKRKFNFNKEDYYVKYSL